MSEQVGDDLSPEDQKKLLEKFISGALNEEEKNKFLEYQKKSLMEEISEFRQKIAAIVKEKPITLSCIMAVGMHLYLDAALQQSIKYEDLEKYFCEYLKEYKRIISIKNDIKDN